MRFQIWLLLLLLLPYMAASAAAEPTGDPGSNRVAAQWPLELVGARGLPEKGIDGSGIVVAVLDSGFDHGHPDFSGRVWINEDEVPGNLIDDDLNGYIDDTEGWDACNDAPARASPPFHHGTFVAGIIGADGRSHDGVLGVAPGATLMDIQVFCDDNDYPSGEGTLDPDSVREGIHYAIDNGAHVIHMSLQLWRDEGPGTVNELLRLTGVREAFERAHEANILVVVAAGNQGQAGVTSPADQPHVFVVGATTGCGFRHGFSNYGEGVHIWAPGRALSTTPGGYGWDAGTSFAAPLVSGAAALMLQAEPGLAPDELRDRLLASATASEDGPVLDLRPLFGAPAPKAPGTLYHPEPTAVGATHYVQFQARTGAPLLHVSVPGVNQWCLDTTRGQSFFVQPTASAPVTVAARLHSAASGPWLETQFTYDPKLPSNQQRPALAVTLPDDAEVPAVHATALAGLIVAAALRRQA